MMKIAELIKRNAYAGKTLSDSMPVRENRDSSSPNTSVMTASRQSMSLLSRMRSGRISSYTVLVREPYLMRRHNVGCFFAFIPAFSFPRILV